MFGRLPLRTELVGELGEIAAAGGGRLLRSAQRGARELAALLGADELGREPRELGLEIGRPLAARGALLLPQPGEVLATRELATQLADAHLQLAQLCSVACHERRRRSGCDQGCAHLQLAQLLLPRGVARVARALRRHRAVGRRDGARLGPRRRELRLLDQPPSSKGR